MTKRRIQDKTSHIDVALAGAGEFTQRGRGLWFEQIGFVPKTLPEVDFEKIDLRLNFLNKPIALPLMIAPMTGGLKKAAELNRLMARVAEQLQIPFGVGSQRVALETKSREKQFQVRAVAPTIPLFANIGAVQLVKGMGPVDAERAVDMIEADALFLHLNAMQEVIQEGGDTAWSGVLFRIEKLCEHFAQHNLCPVFAREVGFGLAEDQVQKLISAGVTGLDCAGRGGTSWTQVEGHVATSSLHQEMGQNFADWGLTTPESILSVRKVAPHLPLIASGGLRSGVDLAKAVGLGATLGAMAQPVLRAAHQGEAELVAFFARITREFRAVLFGVGARDLVEFRQKPRLRLPGSD